RKGHPPVSTSSNRLSTRHQRFACARLSQLACRDQVPTFPQRSPPSLLTTAACGGLRPAPDCRPRRALLHLSYSSALSYSDSAFVTHAPFPPLEGCSATGCNDHSQTLCGPPSMTRRAGGVAASGTLKADTGWVRPFNARLPRSSTAITFSTAAAT